MRKSKSKLVSTTLLAIPLSLASATGCSSFKYAGKTIYWQDIRNEAKIASDNGTAETTVNLVDHDNDGDIDSDDTKWHKVNVKILTPIYIGVDTIRKGWGYVKEAYQKNRVPLLNSQNFNDKE